MTHVQVSLPDQLVAVLDGWIAEGRFTSRSDAIRAIIRLWDERERTRAFRAELDTRSKDARDHPDQLVSIEDL